MSSQKAYLLGEEDGSESRYYYIADATLLPGVPSGAHRYLRGSGVAKALEEGKVQTVDQARTLIASQNARHYLVHLPNGKTLRFRVQRTAEQYAKQSGGTLEVVTPDV